MKAVIPVAGIGRRLRPHTYSTPKALVPVAGKAILSHILDDLVGLGVTDLVLIVGGMGDQIRSFVSRRYEFKTSYVHQEDALGIAHALYQCRSLVDDEPLVIVLGDTIYRSDFSVIKRGFKGSAIGVKSLSGDLTRVGLVEVSDGIVIRLVEKPDVAPSDLAIAGVYYIRNSGLLMECIDELIQQEQLTHGEYQLTDALQRMIDKGEHMTTFPVDAWYDCGTVERLLSTNRILLDEAPGVPAAYDENVIVPPVSIAPDASITGSVIGPHVTVSEGVTIDRSVLSDSIVCQQASVKDSRLWGSVIGVSASVTGISARINVGDSSEVSA